MPTTTSTSTPTPAYTSNATPASTPEVFRPIIPVEDVLTGQVQRLHASPDGALWLITDEGVARMQDGTWRVYLTDFTGELVGIDAAGRVWVVSEDMMQITAFRQSQDTAWDGASWIAYGADEGWSPVTLEDERYRGIGWGQSDGMGGFWLTTPQDVRFFDGQRWKVFTPEAMGMGEVGPEALWATFAMEIAESTGMIWVGECDWGGPGPFGGQGVRWFDGSTVSEAALTTGGQNWHGADSPVGTGCVTVIEEDGQGRIWMGVDDRLWRYEPAFGEWTEFAPPEPPVDWTRFGFAHAIALDPSNDPWPAMVLCGASCYGKIVLYRVQDGAWTQIGEALEFGGFLPPHEVVVDATGTRWLFWAGSVYRVGEGVLEPVPGLGFVRHIVVGAAGRVWFVVRHEGRDVLRTLNTGAED